MKKLASTTVPALSICARELGRQLRSAQKQSGRSARELATMLGWTTTKVSKTMSGHASTRDVDVAAFLAVCGVIGTKRRAILPTLPHAARE